MVERNKKVQQSYKPSIIQIVDASAGCHYMQGDIQIGAHETQT